MSSNNKKRLLSETRDDSNQPNKKRKVMIDDDENKEIRGLDATEHEEEEVIDTANAKIKNELMRSGEPITLNVGGTKYQTSLHTLTKYRHSVLSKMFEGKFSLKPSKDGSYFIDRNGTFFGMILDYLRTGQIIIPQTDRHYVILHLLMEAQYYQIASLELKVKIMSIDSHMLSPQQIIEIHTMIHKQTHTFNWKLLYKYNITDNICLRGLKHTDASMWKDVTSVIRGLKSVLILMMKNGVMCGVFIGKEIPDGNGLRFDSISEGFAFQLNSIDVKIELNRLNIDAIYPYGESIRLSVKNGASNPDWTQKMDSLFNSCRDPSALEIYQL